jgi:hypothetical protein
MSGLVSFIIAFIIVFAIGMFIRSLLKKAKKPADSGNITITPQVNIGNNNAAPPQSASASFCSNCGNKIEAGSGFCSNCGTKVA